jgi:hypothetical protein
VCGHEQEDVVSSARETKHGRAGAASSMGKASAAADEDDEEL